jgi:hypothetical protein
MSGRTSISFVDFTMFSVDFDRVVESFLVTAAFVASSPCRRDQIPIAPAAPSVPNFPRLRALALFGRRPPQRMEGFVMPASLHNSRDRGCKRSEKNLLIEQPGR